jgi:hypothetical protein
MRARPGIILPRLAAKLKKEGEQFVKVDLDPP